MKNKKTDATSEPIEVTLSGLAFGGKGVGRHNGKVVFVEKGLPGQRVLVQPYKNRSDYVEGRVVEVLENTSVFEEPRCPDFPVCGGCAIQNMTYDVQLSYKREWVTESLTRIGGFRNIPVDDTEPSPERYFYRNKMEYSFSDKVWDPGKRNIKSGECGLGLHLPGRFDTVVNIERCYLQSELSNRILSCVRTFAAASGLPAYSPQKHTGFWHSLVIREGKQTGDVLVNLITDVCRGGDAETVGNLARTVQDTIPGVSAFFHSEKAGKGQSMRWGRSTRMFGREFIHEKIGGYTFRIDGTTFFQTNSRQCEKLYDHVKKAGHFTGSETVYDLFSGAGIIPIYISDSVRQVVGMELDERSVAAARVNAERNGVSNCRFIQGKVRTLIKYVPPLFKEYGKPDVIIADPPRSGMDRKTVERIEKLAAGRIIYVSCNPSTLARDLAVLADSYTVVKVVPVDMFPHTAHVESVTTLVRKKT